MTRILHLSMLYPPHIMGGAERSVALLAEAQVRAGHEVAAACTTPDRWHQETRPPARRKRQASAGAAIAWPDGGMASLHHRRAR